VSVYICVHIGGRATRRWCDAAKKCVNLMGKNSGERRMQVLIMRQNAACEECRARMMTAEFVVPSYGTADRVDL
jgi:hypothetical protein